MKKIRRVFDMHGIFSQRRYPISKQSLMEELKCSKATVERYIKFLQDELFAPLKYDRERSGYYYALKENERYELPGLWFNASEIHALMIAQKVLHDLKPGLLDDEIAPIQKRIDKILQSEPMGKGNIADRVRILQKTARQHDTPTFKQCANALAIRKRIECEYHARNGDEVTRRIISPQRLVHYNGAWYLDAYCHLRKSVRTFAIDRLRNITTLPSKAEEISEEMLNEHLGDAYGIFSGKATQTAVLLFSAEQARWVADEVWHPNQQSQRLPNGRYELRIPYHQPQELIMDILRYGPDVEVIAPPELREAVKQKLMQAVGIYC